MSPQSLYTRVLILLLSLLGAGQAQAERTTTYYHTDALGSVVAATSEAGAVLWRKDYAPYGAQLASSTGGAEKLSYTGKAHDAQLGITHFGARQYDPEIGRFLSVDPVGFIESNPMSFNRYLYVNDNPYKYVDPDGEFLNFAAKFVLDVAVNIAFNYVTSGSLGVTSALRESVQGIVNPAKTVVKIKRLTQIYSKQKTRQTVGSLRAAGKKDAHHVIQDASVRDLPGYNTNAAPGIQLAGPSNVTGTPHNIATAVQRQAGGGTYTAERRIGYKAMRKAGVSREDARGAIRQADEYFGSIGVKPSTPTRIPGNR